MPYFKCRVAVKNCINVLSATGNIILTQIITNIFSVLVYFLPTTSAGSHEIHLMCLQLLIHNIVFIIHTQIYMISQGLLLRPFDLTPLTKLHYPLIYTHSFNFNIPWFAASYYDNPLFLTGISFFIYAHFLKHTTRA